MNTQVFTLAPSFNKPTPLSLAVRLSAPAFAAIVLLFVPWAHADWNIDLSHRQKTVRDKDLQDRAPASGGNVTSGNGVAPVVASQEKGILDYVFEGSEPTQELVILNTEKGFVPANVRVRKGGKYLIHVVNVSERDKNVSFVLDGFSEHHATYYGKVKSFRIEPQKEGIYSYQCPETSSEGRLTVFAGAGAQNLRLPAAANTKGASTGASNEENP